CVLQSSSLRSVFPSFPIRRSSDLSARLAGADGARRQADVRVRATDVTRLPTLAARAIGRVARVRKRADPGETSFRTRVAEEATQDRKSTRLNSSLVKKAYAVFCLN